MKRSLITIERQVATMRLNSELKRKCHEHINPLEWVWLSLHTKKKEFYVGGSPASQRKKVMDFLLEQPELMGWTGYDRFSPL